MPLCRVGFGLCAAFAVVAGSVSCSDSPDRSRASLPAPFPAGTPDPLNGTSNGGSSSNSPNPGVAGSEMRGNLPLQPNPAGPPPVGTPGAGEDPGSTEPSAATLSRVLVFTRTLSYRHDSIGPGVAALQKLGTENGFTVDPTEDPTWFNDATLADFDVVVWLSTTADVLDDAQQSAFQRYIQAGGGWVGVHAASDTEYGWAWYGQLIGNGAWFRVHPAIQTAQLVVEQQAHESTAHLPAAFSLQDEWYNFRANPRASVTVLLRLDETSYAPGEGAMGDHPIAWYHEFEGGRAWYTALGHRTELYTDPQYTRHLLGGLRWAAGVAP
jgi:cytochrome c